MHPWHLNLKVAGCLAMESAWKDVQGWRRLMGQKSCPYTCTLLFCYLTVVVEKLYSEIGLSGFMQRTMQGATSGMTVTEWPEGGA